MSGFQQEIKINAKNLECLYTREKKSMEKIRGNSDVQFFRQKH